MTTSNTALPDQVLQRPMVAQRNTAWRWTPSPWALLGFLLAVHTGLVGWSATRHSPCVDEAGHLVAGVSHWSLGRFDLYRVNPPLARLVATVPVVLSRPELDWAGYSDGPGSRAEFPLGRRFIELNGERSLWFMTISRWACLPFSWLAAIICYAWASELFGRACGLFAAALWCLSPLVIGYAELITPDTAAAAFGVAVNYLLWRWLKRPSWSLAAGIGALLGLTLATKATWIILVPAIPCCWICWLLLNRSMQHSRLLIEGAQILLMMVVALDVLNCVYGFERTGEPLGDLRFVSKSLKAAPHSSSAEQAGNRFENSILGSLPIPVPANFLLGIDVQKRDFEQGYRSYLRGEWRHGGWWYYYLYALAVKAPLGTWIIACVAVFLVFIDSRYRAALADEAMLLWAPVAIIALVSSQTGFNHHLRYILPAFPFLFIWISRVARTIAIRAWAPAGVSMAAFVWSVISLATVYPHCLSYFNELAGGPRGGDRHLLDSNIDWGQDLLHLKWWLDAHPEARPLGLAYFGMMDPRVLGIDFEVPPKAPLAPADYVEPRALTIGPRPGWYALSVTFQNGFYFPIFDGQGKLHYIGDEVFTYFRSIEPTARAGYSIRIFHLDLARANEMRQQLGLPLLAETDEL